MARPIRDIEPAPLSAETQRQKDLEEVEQALADNKEAVLGAIDLMNNLHKNGITRIANGLVSEGDKVLEIIVQEISKDENTNALRNMLLMVGVLGTIDMRKIEPLLLKLNNGIERVAEDPDPDEKTGYFDLAKKLKDPQINRSLTILMRFLEGMGQETKDQERN
ncbi:DUF1641 domain-containing protein [Alkalicoccus luteus]|uniref:DUF1641 domain-containing protein n=1 Tax=Alkalicoccus luteus TaxID=1237094 RepID=A0A969PMT9_9BACI|nr:DUF1641 domain-containing protein [Alkalicoccus luteus]NJP37091.1 DUF1641 domain-containing protein [Alkalicoccus luteus]